MFYKPETLPQIRAFGSRVTTANRALPFLYLSRLVSGGFLGLQASSTVTTSHGVGKLQSQFGVLPRSPRCTVYGSKKKAVSCLTSRENRRNHKKQKLKKISTPNDNPTIDDKILFIICSSIGPWTTGHIDQKLGQPENTMSKSRSR